MNNTAKLIKIGAVVTAAPRWIVALLLAEGLALPEAWLPWWVILSAVLSAGMAVTEALAFAYIFEAWRNQRDRKSDTLLILAGVAAVIFIAVVAPYVVANIRQEPLGVVLGVAGTWLWGIAVAASTIVIVAAVGFAQKSPAPSKPAAEKPDHAGKMPEEKRQDTADWRTLPDEDRQLIAKMSSAAISTAYGVSERTARGWRLKAQALSESPEASKNGRH